MPLCRCAVVPLCRCSGPLTPWVFNLSARKVPPAPACQLTAASTTSAIAFLLCSGHCRLAAFREMITAQPKRWPTLSYPPACHLFRSCGSSGSIWLPPACWSRPLTPCIRTAVPVPKPADPPVLSPRKPPWSSQLQPGFVFKKVFRMRPQPRFSSHVSPPERIN